MARLILINENDRYSKEKKTATFTLLDMMKTVKEVYDDYEALEPEDYDWLWNTLTGYDALNNDRIHSRYPDYDFRVPRPLEFTIISENPHLIFTQQVCKTLFRFMSHLGEKDEQQNSK